jgi:long-chain acyl-CoA synthetase
MKDEGQTVPGIFLKVTDEHGPLVAMRNKDFGIWNEFTWGDYRKNVEAVFHGLKHFGLQRGDVVCILSENRPEWVFTDLACQCAGALPLGIYVDSLEPELQFAINNNRARFILLEDQEQTDKILNILDKIPTLEKCVVIDWDGMEDYKQEILVSFDEILKLGEKRKEEHPDEIKETVASLKAEDVAFLCLTSGTTKNPKSVMLTHKCVLELADAMMAVDKYGPDDEEISYLPLPWIVERFFSVIFHLKARYRVNFPETMQLNVVFQNMREICPSILICAPRVWENFCTTVYIKHENASWFKRKIFQLLIPIAEQVAQNTLKKNAISFWLALGYWFGDLFLYRKIRERLGFRLLRFAYTGGAAIGPEIYTFFHAMGVDLRQIYGQTEIGGVCCVQPPGEADPETTGKPLPGIEIKISESDEILVHSANFRGYYNLPEGTTELQKDGFLLTGDQGYFSERGHLVVIDRQKDIIRTSSQYKFSPQLVENRLKFSPYIKEAIVVGQDKPYVAALIQIDMENVGNWAQRRGIPYTTFRDLASKPKVIELIGEAIERTNKKLDDGGQIKRFKLLEKELDPDDAEVTRTRKLRRDYVNTKYKDIIEDLYV